MGTWKKKDEKRPLLSLCYTDWKTSLSCANGTGESRSCGSCRIASTTLDTLP
jgi:hypothetical protein